MKKIIALTVAMAAATGANAAWDYGKSEGFNENGELLFFMYDENVANKISGVQDLGIRYNTMRDNIANGSFTQTFSLDSSVFGNFDSIVNKSTLRWGVMAFSQGFLDADYGMMVTSSGSLPFVTASDIDNALNKQVNYIFKVNGSDTDFSTNNAVFGTDPNNRFIGSGQQIGNRSLGNTMPFSSDGGIEEALAFNLFTFDFIETVNNSQFVGNWTMDLANKTVTYNAISTPEVPVPAAAWLMGSALIGLSGVARRRRV